MQIWLVWQGNYFKFLFICKYYIIIKYFRPFLADPEFVKKAAENRADEINTCIGCNQVN